MNEPQPEKFDVVLGGTGNTPEFALILGGIQGVQRGYNNPDPKVRINAISQALNYGDDGVNLLLQALTTADPPLGMIQQFSSNKVHTLVS